MKPPFFHLIMASIICTVVLSVYGVWYGTITTTSTTAANLQKKIDTKTESVSRTTSARATLAEIADDEATLQGYFVPEAGVVAFINDIEARGRILGATVTVLSVSIGPVSTTTPQTLTLSLVCEGTFDSVMRTVGIIEHAPYYLSLASLSVVQDNKNSWRANMQILVGSVTLKSTTNTQVKASSTPTLNP